MTQVRLWSTASAAMLVAATAAIVAAASASYSGSPHVFLAFTAVFFLAIGLIFPRPRLYAYGFFAALLFLGFWPKAVLHFIWGVPFLEATGSFSGSPPEWDKALTAATFGAAGLCLARIAHLLFARRRGESSRYAESTCVPQWFAAHRRAVWAITIVAIIGLNSLNYICAFYKIGVNPLLVLPLKLNVLASWLINIGFALWSVTLVWWEIHRSNEATGVAIAVPLLEAFLSSTSAMSRGIFVFHAVPYLIALAPRFAGPQNQARARMVRQIALAFFGFLLISLAIVFWQRLPSMHGDDILERPHMEVLGTFSHDIAVQVPQLLLKRWVGLEGVLAVQSHEPLTFQLFMTVLTESPNRGADSLFQQIAKVDFNRSDPTKTYLSNAGPIAVLFTAGSFSIVLFGVLGLGLILIATELYASGSTGNPLLVSVAGAGLANVIAQTNFTYLTAAFMIELWVTTAILGALQKKN